MKYKDIAIKKKKKRRSQLSNKLNIFHSFLNRSIDRYNSPKMDNKYANLTGIARNEPDVYETTNSPANNEKINPQEDDSNSVQKIVISTKEAHEKFNKNSLNSDYVGMLPF